MERHPDVGVLAALAEGNLPGDEAEVVRAHVAGCRSCMAAFADALRYRTAWLAYPDGFDVPPELVREARTISLRPPTRPPWRREHLRLAVGALAFASLIVAAIGVRLRPAEAPCVRFELPASVAAARVSRAANDWLLPGEARIGEPTLVLRRAGRAPEQGALNRDARERLIRYEAGTRGPDSSAALVAVLLAEGDLDAARAYADEAGRQHPLHVPLLVLGAAVHQRRSEFVEAEALLRRAEELAPSDPIVTLDLGLLLANRGDTRGARLRFERAARTQAPTAARRARQELARLR